MKKEIFIYLLNEGTDVWIPTEAEHIKDNIYKIILWNKSSDDETWEFSTSDCVHCEEKTYANGNIGLVAAKNRKNTYNLHSQGI